MEPPNEPPSSRAEALEHVRQSAQLIGKKWHPVVLRVLALDGPAGFSGLQERLEPISGKVLTDSLDDLQEKGLVQRRVLNESPLRVEYGLTDRGEAFQPVLDALAEWGESHLSTDRRPIVLVIDDNRGITDMCASWLNEDYDVRTAYDGKEGLRQFGPEVDVAIIDRRLPGIEGDRISTLMIRENPLCRTVMLTSKKPDFDVLDFNFDRYLTKPTTREELQSVVAELLEQREAPTDARKYFALRSKQVVLEATKLQAELDDDERYQRLRERTERLAAELDGDIDGAVELAIGVGSADDD